MHCGNRSTKSNSLTFSASASKPNLNFRLDLIPTTDRNSPSILHQLTFSIPSTSASITAFASKPTPLLFTGTPPPSSDHYHTENTLPYPPSSNYIYRSVPRINPTFPSALLKACKTARTQPPTRVCKTTRARKAVTFNKNYRIDTFFYEGSSTYSSSTEMRSLTRFPDKPSKRRGRSSIMGLTRPSLTSPSYAADLFNSAPYDVSSPSALGL